MLVKQESQRLSILVDADNAEILGKGQRVQLDLVALADKINHRQLVRAIYYKPESRFSEAARQHVERKGFEAYATFKNSDAWIIADAIALAQKVDVLCFVGLDRDFEPVIPMLKSLGVRVEGWGWPGKVSETMQHLMHSFRPLTPDLIERAHRNTKTKGNVA
ncbi:NYN domain protein [Gimesia alba]|uniref:NYN domain protein n=1 Tax=Gimesia alba TaxID=2527973 RepID=A0A517RHZ7_9PLAN|nr:NYN domain-containing protein [Gimesia alba]QDT43495.1 NYN domain protein [Gimesia alba]